MNDQAKTDQKRSRLKRLTQVLVVAAVVWIIVATARTLMPPAPLPLARAAVTNGQFDVAVEHYLQYLAKRPNDWEVRTELGLVLAEIDRPRALVEFRKVPPDAEPYLAARRVIANICISSERIKEAEEVLLELTEKTPNDFQPHFQLAELYFRQRRASAALPFAMKSIELDAESPAAHFLVAELLDDLGRTGEMIEPLQRVLELQLDNYAAHLDLAYAYSEAGQPDKSRREAEWCLARNPEDVIARRFLAQSARDEGKVEEATLEVERALVLAPDDFELRLLEAELLLFAQQNEKVLERLRPLYETRSGERRLVALLARAAAGAGHAVEAAKYRQQIQKLSE